MSKTSSEKKQTDKEHYHWRHRTKDLQPLQPRQDVYFLSSEGPSVNNISSTIMSTTPQSHSYLGEHQGHQYCCTRHHTCATDFSKHCPIMRLSQPLQHSSTEPARKKSCIPRLSTVSTHRKCEANLWTAIQRPLSTTNKTTTKRITVITRPSNTKSCIPDLLCIRNALPSQKSNP